MSSCSYYLNRICSGWLFVSIFLVIPACNTLDIDTDTETTDGTHASALLLKDHTLVDRIWDVNAEMFIDKSQLLISVMQADYILLGENHDNMSHHINQTWLIENLSKNGHNASVSFEMIDNQQGVLISNINITSSTVLIDTLNQIYSNWNYETYYRDLFDSVIHAGFKIYPANIDRKTMKHSVMQDKPVLSPGLGEVLSNTPLPSKQKAMLQKEINQSHCGMLDTGMVDRMVEMQRIRDAAMTVSLLDSENDLKVLIAGINHVRKDHGVPMYLLRENKNANIISIAPIEVESDHHDISNYKKHWQDEILPFDYVWFTASAKRPSEKEFCTKLKKHFKGNHEK